MALEAIADEVVVCDEDAGFVNAVELDVFELDVVELDVAVIVGLADVVKLDIVE